MIDSKEMVNVSKNHEGVLKVQKLAKLEGNKVLPL